MTKRGDREGSKGNTQCIVKKESYLDYCYKQKQREEKSKTEVPVPRNFHPGFYNISWDNRKGRNTDSKEKKNNRQIITRGSYPDFYLFQE